MRGWGEAYQNDSVKKFYDLGVNGMEEKTIYTYNFVLNCNDVDVVQGLCLLRSFVFSFKKKRICVVG